MVRTSHLILLLAFCPYALGQVAYPDCYVQDEEWTDDTHHYMLPQKIFSPGDPGMPVSISGTADAEFVSGTQVRLTPGFHAGGFTGNGRFRARIDQGIGSPDDVVAITPDPATHVIDNVLHVNKWEKLEIGLRLPQDHQDAVDRFFANYYSNGVTQPATPGNVEAGHDLNPYADDSLQLVMTLTSPSGSQRMKWGFFMREAAWSSAADTAVLTENDTSSLHLYPIRFRFAPDEVGTWQFTLFLKAPHTATLADEPLAPLLYTGYGFVCEPPLPDNKGYLRVNEHNRRTLQFETGEALFGLGTNMADWRRRGNGYGYYYRQRDYDVMRETMEQLHDVGGNFLRMYLMRFIFAPEWVNLGVYDHYTAIDPCEGGTGAMPTVTSNGQYHCWAFDRMLDQARANNLYVQLCIDPYPPIKSYENFIWGNHPYLIHFLEPDRNEITGKYDLKSFFYTNGDPLNKVSGVFYYWKRKYKYIMSRWGYSVNIAAVEPFNEIDQMLTYQDLDHTDNGSICLENRFDWGQDDDLPATINDWLTDISEYVRDPVDLNDPVASPLGEGRKLFLMSYTDVASPTDTDHHLPFTNPKVDLIDVHRGLWWGEGEVRNSFDESQEYRDTYLNNGNKKPFVRGEHNYYAKIDLDGNPVNGSEYETSKIFSNYDVSFHNELWASTFFGNFAGALTWHWERVFWWPDALPEPSPDNQNQFQTTFSNAIGAINNLNIGGQDPILVTNRRLHHHFKPLSEFLSNPNLQAYDLFNGEFTSHRVYDDVGKLECYYLMNDAQDLAIGWVHNLNAYWEKNYYATSTHQNFLGSASPTTQTIALPGFLSGTDYYISWFPTRMNTAVCPDDDEDLTGTGTVILDLSTAPLNGIVANHLDTLHSDYAFIIATSLVKNLPLPPKPESTVVDTGWDFTLYPNPTREELFLKLPDDAPVNITLHDLSGRSMHAWSSVNGPLVRLPVGQLAQGVYWVRISDGMKSKTKKLIIH